MMLAVKPVSPLWRLLRRLRHRRPRHRQLLRRTHTAQLVCTQLVCTPHTIAQPPIGPHQRVCRRHRQSAACGGDRNAHNTYNQHATRCQQISTVAPWRRPSHEAVLADWSLRAADWRRRAHTGRAANCRAALASASHYCMRHGVCCVWCVTHCAHHKS